MPIRLGGGPHVSYVPSHSHSPFSKASLDSQGQSRAMPSFSSTVILSKRQTKEHLLWNSTLAIPYLAYEKPADEV